MSRPGGSTANEPRPARRRRTAIVIAAAAVALVLLGTVAFFATRGGGESTTTASAIPTPAATASPTASAAPTSTPTATPTPVPTPEPPVDDSATAALAALAAIPTTARNANAPYNRDLFGQPWTDVDRNGCDTRNDILGRDLLTPVFKAGTGDCKVLSGTLIEPYDGQAIDFVSGWDTSILVQIDHVVPLGWSWHNGSDAWTDERRTEFANDPRNLLASSEAMNQEKSASGPGEWLPPVPELRCVYVEKWVEVLTVYGLTIDSADRAASEAVLRAC